MTSGHAGVGPSESGHVACQGRNSDGTLHGRGLRVLLVHSHQGLVGDWWYHPIFKSSHSRGVSARPLGSSKGETWHWDAHV